MGLAFNDYFCARRAEIDARLDATLKPCDGLPDELLEAMRYSLLAPGKRLRPLLVLLANEAVTAFAKNSVGADPRSGENGYQDADPWPAACSVEMIHVYSLIHDDLPAMDDDDMRRGQPTCHRRFGEANAILAGDALLTLAFQTLAEGYPGAVGSMCCADLARAAGAVGMVGGQVVDLAWERNASADRRTLAELESLHARKTGALIRACLRLGTRVAYAASPAGPPRELVQRMDGYGRCLGLAFQITDDLLDVEGEHEHTGKRVGKDAARGKLTYPGLLGVEESRRRADALGQEACDCVAALGSAAEPLRELVSFVLTRDR
jgi:geranylgeranyl diphosphate synthase type II